MLVPFRHYLFCIYFVPEDTVLPSGTHDYFDISSLDYSMMVDERKEGGLTAMTHDA